MSYQPVSGIVPQYSNDSNELASGFYLKFYIANTTTPLSMATDSTGGTLLVKAKLNPDGLPISNPLDNDTVFIPHVNQDYRLVIYRNEADADANNTAGAFLNVPSIEPLTGNTVTTSTGSQTVAGALDDRVVYLKNVESFSGLSPTKSNQGFLIEGFYSNSSEGGDSFFWDPTAPKSKHDGGVFISNTVPKIADQAGANFAARVKNYLDGAGETDPGGNGCFVRQYKFLTLYDFGGVSGDNSASAALRNRYACQAVINYLESIGGGQYIVPAATFYWDVSVPIVVPSNISCAAIPGVSKIEILASTIVDRTTRPAGTVNSAVFYTGDTATEAFTNWEVPGDSIELSNIYFDGLTINLNYTEGSLATDFLLNGLYLIDVDGGHVKNCRITNMPNNGIYVKARNFLVSENYLYRNGFGSAQLATRNAINVAVGNNTGIANFEISFGVRVTNNVCVDNAEVGVQFGLNKGILIQGNYLVGNGTYSIEGDGVRSTTNTEASVGAEIPGDTMIIGNYIDCQSRYDATLQGTDGIQISSGNEGRFIISNNTIRNGRTSSAIFVFQNDNGSCEIHDNYIEGFTIADDNTHIIAARMKHVSIERNKIVDCSVTDPTFGSGAIVVYGNPVSVSIKDNKINDPFIADMALISVTSGAGTVEQVDISGNIARACRREFIRVRTTAVANWRSVSIKGNTGYNINLNSESLAAAVVFWGLGGGGAWSVVTASVSAGNHFQYNGSTRYPIYFRDVNAGEFSNLAVIGNELGNPTMPSGTSTIDPIAPVTTLFEDSNHLI